MSARLFVALQYLLPQHLLSRAIHFLARRRGAIVKNALIGAFVRGFRPDMTDAVEPDPMRYPSFNAFFTRALRPGTRPIARDRNMMTSPVDGTISQIGRIDGSQLFQAKGHSYSLSALLADSAGSSERFVNGSFATLYLAPYNYHRIHMPVAARLRASWYVPGRLFSVNATTAAAVPGLFARNERIVCMFEYGATTFAMVLIGALFVGSMSTVWHGDVTPRRPRRACTLPLPGASALHLERGAEMGRFNMGSTVIVLWPRDTIDWLPGFTATSRVRVGEALAQLRLRDVAATS